MEGDRGGGVCDCLLEVPERCSCQVNILQCTLKASRLLGINALNGCLFHCAIVRRKKAVFVVVVGGGYLSVFVWVVGCYLAVSGLEVLVGIDVLEIICNVAFSWPTLEQRRAEARLSTMYKLTNHLQDIDPNQILKPGYFPVVVIDHKPCCPVQYSRAAVFEV